MSSKSEVLSCPLGSDPREPYSVATSEASVAAQSTSILPAVNFDYVQFQTDPELSQNVTRMNNPELGE